LPDITYIVRPIIIVYRGVYIINEAGEVV